MTVNSAHTAVRISYCIFNGNLGIRTLILKVSDKSEAQTYGHQEVKNTIVFFRHYLFQKNQNYLSTYNIVMENLAR